ncbi:Tol-Pal system beta propeller repeat protein TolB [Dissulfurirhabdus thermomarina]|nr:Tol-Pal system beta propeller repeat protein TolB [Dissulfurirhabdus thermomarina]NMX22922.1 Tol-Pal system beta propeller repeat protein TolB [Dissulfurirhabdus thermomarina]
MKRFGRPGASLAAVLFFAVLWTGWGAPARARVYIDITSPYLKQIPIAVPYLLPESGSAEEAAAGRRLARILSDDLAFHGVFSVLDPAVYGGRPDADWSRFRVDYLVKGSVRVTGETLVAELRLFDQATGDFMDGRRYTGRTADLRTMAHRFCDVVLRAVTGEGGVSLSRIAAVITMNGAKEVYTADFDGYGLRRETFDRGITVSPRLSPDGRYLAYTSYRTGRPALYLKDLQTGKTRRLAAFDGLNIAPAWHPDGRRLAVTLSKDGSPDIYLMDLEGRVLRRLTWGPSINVSPTWAPDGRRLAFVSDRGGSPQVYVLDTASGEIRRLTYQGDYNTDPQWSPRGDRIAYVGRVEGTFQVFTIPAEGGDPVQLTTAGSNENPAWSPDGRQILFSSTRYGGRKALYVMFADGEFQRLLLTAGDGVAMPSWGPEAAPGGP